ncbi:MAG: hypothetical protein ACRDV7_01460, partial [Acidimicrobiia bacterium]
YLFAAIANDPGHLMLRYCDVFDDLSGTLAAIARHIGVAPPDARAEDAVRVHLEPSLRHHVAEPSQRDDNPLMELAAAVWNGGRIDLDLVPPVIANGIARGWFRPPVDGELLARARADVVSLKESVRRLSRQRNPSRP